MSQNHPTHANRSYVTPTYVNRQATNLLGKSILMCNYSSDKHQGIEHIEFRIAG